MITLKVNKIYKKEFKLNIMNSSETKVSFLDFINQYFIVSSLLNLMANEMSSILIL